MTGFLFRRLAAALLLLVLVLTITFFLLQLAPGDPTRLFDDPRIPEDHRRHLRQTYGLDRPFIEQYLAWLGAVTLKWEWGISYVHLRPVTAVVAERLPATFLLATAGMAVQFALGLLLGVAAARRPNSVWDHLIRIASLLLYSLPFFWLGLMLILAFASFWPILPAGGMRSVVVDDLPPLAPLLDLARHLLLPALALGLPLAGEAARFVRNSLLEALGQDYIRTARAKGLSEARVVWIHGLRNSLLPLIQIFGLTLPALLSGALAVEYVFAWPGLGRLTWAAIFTRDYPLVLATTALAGALVVLGNLLADVLHAVVDPRVRHA